MSQPRHSYAIEAFIVFWALLFMGTVAFIAIGFVLNNQLLTTLGLFIGQAFFGHNE